MEIHLNKFSVSTDKRNEMKDITDRVQMMVDESGLKEGDVIIQCPHTTAGITINENADPSVVHDILMTLSELFPHNRSGYRHAEGNSDAHCKSSVVGCSEQITFTQGKLNLGTWQGIYFCEFDGPRNRNVLIQVKGK